MWSDKDLIHVQVLLWGAIIFIILVIVKVFVISQMVIFCILNAAGLQRPDRDFLCGLILEDRGEPLRRPRCMGQAGHLNGSGPVAPAAASERAQGRQ